MQIAGIDAFQQPCDTLTPTVATDEVLDVIADLRAALALETQQERDAAVARVLKPITQRHQDDRACAIYERRRADGLLALAGRFNQAVAEVGRAPD